jgi:hypothetical protein
MHCSQMQSVSMRARAQICAFEPALPSDRRCGVGCGVHLCLYILAEGLPRIPGARSSIDEHAKPRRPRQAERIHASMQPCLLRSYANRSKALL